MDKVFQRFKEYDFSSDKGFQSGLCNINSYQLEQAKYFYYIKFIEHFEYQAFLDWDRKPLNEIMEKLSRGEIAAKEIPTTLHSQASKSVMKPPPKPWEVYSVDESQKACESHKEDEANKWGQK